MVGSFKACAFLSRWSQFDRTTARTGQPFCRHSPSLPHLSAVWPQAAGLCTLPCMMGHPWCALASVVHQDQRLSAMHDALSYSWWHRTCAASHECPLNNLQRLWGSSTTTVAPQAVQFLLRVVCWRLFWCEVASGTDVACQALLQMCHAVWGPLVQNGLSCNHWPELLLLGWGDVRGSGCREKVSRQAADFQQHLV